MRKCSESINKMFGKYEKYCQKLKVFQKMRECAKSLKIMHEIVESMKVGSFIWAKLYLSSFFRGGV